MENEHIKCRIIKWANVIKLFWNKYIQKNTFELKNVQNVFGIWLKNILKTRKIVPIRTSSPQIAECYSFLIHCSGIFRGKINIENTSENIKCGRLKEKLGNLP